MNETLVVGDLQALHALRLSLHRRPGRLKLELPGLDPTVRALAEARLARRLSACGCNEGALALLLALAPAAWLGGSASPATRGWLAALALVVVAAALGKGIGILRGRRALQAEVDRIAGLVAARSPAQPG